MSKLVAGYFGLGGNSWLVTEHLKDAIERAGYELFLCTEWDNATKKWSADTWVDDMLACDVILCPQRVDVQPAKSNVKVTTAMALGMPIIASPTQAYKEVVVNGENGFLAEAQGEWYDALVMLKDPALRKKVGEAAKASVGAYSLESITKEWGSTLTDLINGRLKYEASAPVPATQEKEKVLVDIIIASYNNVEYLKLTVSSILLNTDWPYHIIISDGGSGKETWEYLKALRGITVLGEEGKRLSFSETCNAGIQASHQKYFIILNSDVVVSKGWLGALVNKMDTVDRLAACGVMSNCDIGWLHNAPGKPDIPMTLPKSGLQLRPGMKMEEIRPNLDDLYAFMVKSNEVFSGKFEKLPWIAAYAMIFARCAVDEVGLFDPQFKNGCEDLDLCIRLANFGYVMGRALDSFVFHFGGVSRGAYQNENKESYDKEDLSNHAMLYNKWAYPVPKPLDTPMAEHYNRGAAPILTWEGQNRRVVIYTGPGWEPWTKETVDAGMAGSETWAAYLAREFVKKGYRTTLYGDLPADKKNDAVYDEVSGYGRVVYRDHTKMMEDLKYDTVHCFISSRTLEPLRQNVHSLFNGVMIHDVWISNDKNYDIMPWKVHRYGYLSEWHKDFIRQHHETMPVEKMFLTSNGVNMDLYKGSELVTKENMVVYSSSPDRGLYELLQIWPEIRKAVPDMKLYVLYGFLNWEISAKARKDINALAAIDKIKKAMKQDGVEYVGRVDKVTLASYQKRAKVWLYPTWFSETQCISAIENGLAGNALLSSDLAGLKTTVGDSGILLPGQSNSKEYLDRFTAEAIRLIKDEEWCREWAEKARKKALVYTWEHSAQTWIDQFEHKKQ